MVLNTSISEGMSFAVMEAMGCGRPVLVNAIPPNLDLVGESSLSPGRPMSGHRGLAYRTQSEFTAHLLAALADTGAADAMGNRARRHILANHSPEAERTAMEGVLARLLEWSP
jgi:glycosyltransferase involved in cell wall biosynthesis